jgi:anaerobic ribonucleoside-triphosphate reductase activating protein
VGQVVASILGVEGAEGVTFSGGEPFEQAVQLAAVARQVRALRDIGVVCYSGFTLDQLRSNGVAGADELLEQVDLLIDGPFDSARAAPLRWRGSDNQRLHFLTARYRELEEMAATAQTEAEVEIHGVSVVRTGAITGSALGDITRLLTEQYGVKL